MKFHGITLEQGSSVSNLTVQSGTAFPSNPDEGELFFRSDSDIRLKGLYLYVGGSWDRIASTDSLTVPNGAVLPSLANEGDIFYLNTNDSSEGVYVYVNTQWQNIIGSSQFVLKAGDTMTGQLNINSNTGEQLTITSYGINSVVLHKRANGTAETPTAVLDSDALGGWYVRGHNGLNFTSSSRAAMIMYAAENWSQTNNGTDIRFFTTALGATTRVANLKLGPSGQLGVGSSLSYGTAGQVLTSGGAGTAPSWSSTPTLTGTNFTGIPNSALSNNSITIGSTAISLGGTASILAGLSSVTSTTLIGSLTGAASLNVLKAGDTMGSGANLTFTGGGTVTGIPTPVNNSDVINKQYMEQQIAASFPVGQIGQVPFITQNNTRESILDYTVVKGQFIENNEELTDAYTRIVSNETIFSEWYRFSHLIYSPGQFTRAAGITSFKFSSANTSILQTSFPLGSVITFVCGGDNSFAGTYTITNTTTNGGFYVVQFNQALPDVTTPVSGNIPLDNKHPGLLGELSAWSYDSVNDLIVSTANSDGHIGFISKTRYVNYLHEVILKSTASDDDAIGVVIAFMIDANGREHTLTAIRSVGGHLPWTIRYNFYRSDGFTVADKTSFIKWGNGNYGASAAAAGYVSNSTFGWNDFPNGTRVKITRNGDIITAETTDLNESTYIENAKITIDLTSDSRLEKFRGPREIGYSASSQAYASFEVLSFSDINSIYDVRNGDVYHYNDNAWAVVSGTTLVDEIGYGRLLYNPYTKKFFYTSFTDESAIKVSETGEGRVKTTGDTMTGNLIISTNSSSDSLRVTQVGSGNALTIEDSTNPDNTPFVIDSTGRVLIGATSTTYPAGLQIHGTTNDVNFNQTYYGNNATGPGNGFRKSRSSTIGSNVAVQLNDGLGLVNFQGADGTDYKVSASINGYVDATPTTNIVPGRLVFFTSDSTGGLYERLRISSTGAWGLAGANYGTAGQVLTSTGSTTAPTWQSITTVGFADGTVTTPSIYFNADPDTGIYRQGTNSIAFTTGGTQAMTLDSSGNITVTGSITAGTQFLAAINDTVSTPAYSWVSDANTGMYNVSPDNIGFVTGGIERVRVNFSGELVPYDAILMGSNTAGTAAFVRKYAGGFSSTHTPSVPHRIGQLTFASSSLHLTISGTVAISTGSTLETFDITIQIRTNTFPAKAIVFEKTSTSLGLSTADIELYEDTTSGVCVLTYTVPSSILSIYWDLTVAERGNYNLWQQVSTVTSQDLTGLTVRPPTTTTKIISGSLTTAGVIAGSNLSGTNTGDQTITLTGEVTGSGTGSFVTTLAPTAVTPGSYTNANITVDSKGRITSASNGSVGAPGTSDEALMFALTF